MKATAARYARRISAAAAASSVRCCGGVERPLLRRRHARRVSAAAATSSVRCCGDGTRGAFPLQRKGKLRKSGCKPP
ncbi:hypothetical protein [Paenibacillus cisolokensis]|uniref:hypothetical protein n=1 Tax=Paenibacillus cisolokensis TaxID=1658519 RepID=UPI001BCE6471|nr:hypothetical protein [Paenibacillus cisolokensis]